MIKHQKINDARKTIYALGYHTKKLQIELKDVGQNAQFEVNISEFEHFTDVFFDNIFTDWSVQSKIGRSLVKAQETHQKLDKLMLELIKQTEALKSAIVQQEVNVRATLLRT